MAAKRETDQKPVRKKRRGLRFFFTLMILLIAAGAVFYFGWISFQIDEGEYGVVFTKSQGFEDSPLKSGEFAWRWQALLPTNLTLHVFKLENQTSDFLRSGSLPSGEFYAEILGGEVDFHWDVHIRVRYHIQPDNLPTLVAQGLVDSDLDKFYSEYDAKIDSEIGRITGFILTDEISGGDIERSSRLESNLLSVLTDLDSRIKILDIAVLSLKYPDIALYQEGRRLGLEHLEQRQIVLNEVEDSAVRRDNLQEARLTLLEEYGRILDAYPVLLDLFALEGDPGAALLPPELVE